MKSLYIVCLCLISAGAIYAKTCTDFDGNDKIIGQHSAWAHCTASGGKSGTVNSCDCSSPLSIACKKACKKL